MNFWFKLLIFIFTIFQMNYCCTSFADNNNLSNIMVDQLGYLPNQSKQGVLVLSSEGSSEISFAIKDLISNKIVFNGKTQPSIIDDMDSGDSIVKLDFSSLNTPGTYYIEVNPQIKSYPFKIEARVYNPLFLETMHGFYFQRCGTELEKKYAGEWTGEACHLNDAIVLDSGKYLKSVGGWHDAGDYGKKIVPGAVTTGILLKLCELFPSKINSFKLGIPDEKLPDILTEIKYELDWMFTMQRQDGGVYHLIVTKEFPTIGMLPQKDKATRYIVPVSSAATADFAAAMAMAYRVYNKYDSKFARKCLKSAQKAWEFLEKNKTIVPQGGYRDPNGFRHTGGYEDEDDRDERFWAVIELLKTTKEDKYKKYINKIYKTWKPVIVYPFSWKDVHVFAVFEYLTIDDKIANPKIKDIFEKELINYANQIVNRIDKNGYNVALNSNDYYWGSNGVALSYSMLLLMANETAPSQKYVEAALDQLHYVLGKNSLNLSFVTGIGSVFPKNPLYYSSLNSSNKNPIAGFLVGGPNSRGDDSYIYNQITKRHIPPAKCYLDSYYSYSTNEISIYWNALLAFVSGYFFGDVN